MKRRQYTKEYKQEASLLVKQSEQPISKIAKNLGINDNILRRWVKEQSDPNNRSFPGHGNARDEEVAKLKKELSQVKKERDCPFFGIQMK